MKLLVMGATGRTGRILVPLALKRGHAVRVIARDPARVAAPGAEVLLAMLEQGLHAREIVHISAGP
jgi:uncharacterized protein YbjT (DUF2867 family)